MQLRPPWDLELTTSLMCLQLQQHTYPSKPPERNNVSNYCLAAICMVALLPLTNYFHGFFCSNSFCIFKSVFYKTVLIFFHSSRIQFDSGLMICTVKTSMCQVCKFCNKIIQIHVFTQMYCIIKSCQFTINYYFINPYQA